MALALDWWTCSGCGTTYGSRIFTCPRCKSTDLERTPMPKITKHMGASVADPERGYDPQPNQPTRGAPGTDLPTAVAPTPHQALPGAPGSQATSRAPLDSVTEAAHLDAITEARGDVTEPNTDDPSEDAEPGEDVTYERPPIAAPKADWLAYACQEAPETPDLDMLTKAQLIEFVDTLAAGEPLEEVEV